MSQHPCFDCHKRIHNSKGICAACQRDRDAINAQANIRFAGVTAHTGTGSASLQEQIFTKEKWIKAIKIKDLVLKDPMWFPNGTLYYPLDDPFLNLLHRCDATHLGIVRTRGTDGAQCTHCSYEVPNPGFAQLHGANLLLNADGTVELHYKVVHNMPEGTEVAILRGKATVDGMELLEREGKVVDTNVTKRPPPEGPSYSFVTPKSRM